MKFSQYIDLQDIIFSATLAFFITVFIITLKKFIIPAVFILKNESGVLSIKHKGEEKTETIDKCIKLFPFDMFFFNGEIFKRGTNVVVFASSKKGDNVTITEGKFMGRNELDTICILTKEKIIICFIDSIQEMKTIN